MGLADVYRTDLVTIAMIDRMQTVGLKVDLDYCSSLSWFLGLEYEHAIGRLHQRIGFPLNPHSGDQVAAYLFDTLKLPIRRLTASKSRASTEGDVLEMLQQDERVAHEHRAVIDDILEPREIQKMKGTYVDPLPKFVGRDGRLHPNYRITRTATGRLSAFDPNLLAFPKHSTRGKMVRGVVVSGEGNELGEWDLNQIEMRVAAHESQDCNMIAQFLSGKDFHRAGAAERYGKHLDDITDEERFTQKAINFGILMGMTKYGLLDQLHKNGQTQWGEDDTDRMLKEWGKQYPGYGDYVARKHAQARRFGYVTDMWGRIRWLPGVHSSDRQVQQRSLREAQATPIQSGAQGIIKRIMAATWPIVRQLARETFCAPLLQIHDALVFEYDRTLRSTLDAVMLGAMASTVHLRVPITAKGATGNRWLDL